MMDELTGFQRDLLIVVAGIGPDKGIAMKEVIDDYYGVGISHGRLYPNLQALAEEGLVEIGSIDDRTNSYGLTEEGEQLVNARREWENERFEFSSTGDR